MDLAAAAIVLLLLFAASYSGRRTWTVLGSTALSAVLIAGWFLLANTQEAAPFLNTLAEKLPNGWNRPAQNLAQAIERAAVSFASTAPSRHQAAREQAARLQAARLQDAKEPSRAPVSAASVSQWFGGGRSNGPETRPKPATGGPPSTGSHGTVKHGSVKWIAVPPRSGGPMIVLTGANQSNGPLEDIRATLKPDGTDISVPKALRLRLRIEGQAVDGKGAASVPPGVRFHLEAPTLTADQARALRGAIVSFAYLQAGRRRTSIMYLTQAALAARAP